MHFVIPGAPFGKQRPKTTRRGKYAHAYTPEKTVSYENLVKLCYMAAAESAESSLFSDEDELRVEITAYYSIPKSTSKKKKAAMAENTVRPTKKPDIDNVIKVICDALNQIAYKDDSSIVELLAKKYYSEEPRVEVTIEKI